MAKKSLNKTLKKYVKYPGYIIPGIFLLVALFLLLNNLSEWAFLSIGFAVVLAVLVHHD